MTYSFEVKDTVGCHLRWKESEAPAVGTGGLIHVGKEEIAVSLRCVQPLKDEGVVGL